MKFWCSVSFVCRIRVIVICVRVCAGGGGGAWAACVSGDVGEPDHSTGMCLDHRSRACEWVQAQRGLRCGRVIRTRRSLEVSTAVAAVRRANRSCRLSWWLASHSPALWFNCHTSTYRQSRGRRHFDRDACEQTDRPDSTWGTAAEPAYRVDPVDRYESTLTTYTWRRAVVGEGGVARIASMRGKIAICRSAFQTGCHSTQRRT